MRDWFYEIRNPQGHGGSVEVRIPGPLVERYFKSLPIRFEQARCAKVVLDGFKRSFARPREFNEGGWCLTARPLEWTIKERVIVPFPRDLVYAVYMNPRFIVYEWRAEKADHEDDLCPVNWRTRYGALIWKDTS